MKPDFLVFALASLGLCLALHLFWWRRCLGAVHVLGWAAVALILPLGWYAMERAEIRERHLLLEPLQAFAPTYALGMSRMGHSDITLETAPDDPTYLKLIKAQVEWVGLNSRAAAVYTFRPVPDRKYRFEAGEPIQFIVASETDYDRNGMIEGERELRVPIGEVFEDTDDSMLRVFSGVTAVSEEPITDRWGTWISAYAPIYGPDGRVEAAMGVDFSAARWFEVIKRARISMMAYAAFLVLAVAGGVSLATRQLLQEVTKSGRTLAEVSRVAKAKFEMLVNSIEGVVFEWDPEASSYGFVSDQSLRILGEPPGYWSEPARWEARLHEDDRETAIAGRREATGSLQTYSIDYRMVGPGGSVIWIRETGNPVPGHGGRAVLLRGVLTDITGQRQQADEMEKTNRQLVETSRLAGMAEVATGVLHNVGNVLNSVNVASALIHQRLNDSRAGTLAQLADLLKSHAADLPAFFANDPRGKIIPGYLHELAGHLGTEQREVLSEVDKLVKNIEHIKNIVDLQQNYARTGGTMEPLSLVDLVEDALGINSASLSRHRIRVEKDNEENLPPALADRSKLLQILVNLIRNAKHAIDDHNPDERILGIRIARSGGDRVLITVRDTGIGIAAENMSRLFTHGFTTRKHGHGFGLHSSEASAREMNGSLAAASEGIGHGASFTLELGVFRASSLIQPLPAVSDAQPRVSENEAA